MQTAGLTSHFSHPLGDLVAAQSWPVMMKNSSTLTTIRRLANHRRIFILAGCLWLLIVALYLHLRVVRLSRHNVLTKSPTKNASTMRKPKNVTISGLVFYGRKSRVACMRCYVERNMVNNGGWLDEVLWVANTDDAEDLQYLDEIIASDPVRHRKVDIVGDKLWVYSYYKAWQMLERGKYYVKIDDDIVWIDDDAIPLIVTRKINHPNDWVVSANIINNPPLGFLHYHIGALHPYFPDVDPLVNATSSWRPSRDPPWIGPSDYTWPLDKDIPYKGHRWLRVPVDKMISQTPAAELKYEVWGDSYSSWAIAAQMHYSLFENIERNSLDLYRFEKPWNMDGERIRINFMCLYADDLIDTNIESWPRHRGDEDMIVIDLPKMLQRPVMIVGEALGAHFQYSNQPAIADTDILDRYRFLAEERACLPRKPIAQAFSQHA